ncbi:MAG: hypothetical protein ACJ751_27245, partial [Niastella sp.]|uniref:hypothetical protein n=1 Tax=Niastella sp. TaxID=1869183 RepID=UPI00389ACD3C
MNGSQAKAQNSEAENIILFQSSNQAMKEENKFIRKETFNPFFQLHDGMVREYALPFPDRTGTVKITSAGGIGIIDCFNFKYGNRVVLVNF